MQGSNHRLSVRTTTALNTRLSTFPCLIYGTCKWCEIFSRLVHFLIIISQVSSERPGERHPLFPDWSAVCVDITWPEHSSAALPGLHGGAAVPLSGLPPAVTAAVTCSRLFRWLRHNFIHGLPRHCRHWLLFLKRVCRKDKLIFFLLKIKYLKKRKCYRPKMMSMS